MWRAFFIAIGICLLILGAECLVIDRAVLAVTDEQVAPPTSLFDGQPAAPSNAPVREIVPPEWAPWSFLSAGAVVVLYSITVSRGGG